MSEWPMVPLAALGTITTGSTPPTAEKRYYGADVPFVTPAELGSFDAITTTPRMLSHEGSNLSRLLPSGSVLVCCIGSLGKVGIAGCPVVTNQQINAVTFDELQVWPRYGLYACGRLRRTLETMAPATTVAIVSKSKFAELKIPLPPLDEQKRIAAILDQADALRRLRQRAIDRLNELGQAIFYEMFGDPATNPLGWPIGKIGELASSTQYGTSEKAGPIGAFPILRMGNLTTRGEIDFGDLKFIEFKASEVEKYTVKNGDLLFNRTNSPDLVGKTAVFYGSKPFAFAGYLVRLRANEKATSEYVSSFLNSPFGKRTLRGMCKAIIGMANINASELREISIPVPPVALQHAFQRRLEPLRVSRRSLEGSLHELNRLFSSLQHRAFTGQL